MRILTYPSGIHVQFDTPGHKKAAEELAKEKKIQGEYSMIIGAWGPFPDEAAAKSAVELINERVKTAKK